MVQDMSSRGSDLFSNEGVEAFNKCWKLHQRVNSHGERGKDDEVARDAVPHGDDDLTPASHNLYGEGSIVKGKSVVAKPGYSYVVVDRDVGKGDRRCDGKFMADFFSVMDIGASSSNDLRKSQRVQHKRSHAETMSRVTEGIEMETVCNTDVNARTTLQSQNMSMDQRVEHILIEDHDASVNINVDLLDVTEGAQCVPSVDEEMFGQDEIGDFD